MTRFLTTQATRLRRVKIGEARSAADLAAPWCRVIRGAAVCPWPPTPRPQKGFKPGSVPTPGRTPPKAWRRSGRRPGVVSVRCGRTQGTGRAACRPRLFLASPWPAPRRRAVPEALHRKLRKLTISDSRDCPWQCPFRLQKSLDRTACLAEFPTQAGVETLCHLWSLFFTRRVNRAVKGRPTGNKS